MYNKKERLEKIKNSLKLIGYTENYQENNYPYTYENLALKADIVTFNDPIIHDISTSNISVILEENKIAYDNVGISMATPLIIKAGAENIELKFLINENKNNKIQLKYEDIDSYFSENRIDFDLIDEYKNEKMGKQLSLFEASVDVNSKIIEKEFSNMLIKGKKIFKDSNIANEENYKNLISICMNIIAAVIIEHKTNYNNINHNIIDILKKYEKKYNDYFKKETIYKYGEEFIISLYNELDREISYRNINSDILSSFYEDSLFTDNKNEIREIKEKFGNYYTPDILARDMINAIPIELIPENDRYILDGTCGCGSLLHQAFYRLKNLLPETMSNEKKHNYLTKMIEGIDIDIFAKELTKLSFLLISLPFGNGWNIISQDMLIINSWKNRPNIIIANPPFGAKDHKEQKAIKFCNKYIDILKENGYMAIVLPQSILTIKAASNLRKRILDEFDILEIWNFPGGIFKNNCPTVVMILHKIKEKQRNPLILKTVSVEKKENYLTTHEYSEQYVMKNYEQWLQNENYVYEISPLYDICTFIRKNNKKLGNVTNIVDGIILNLEKNKDKISEKPNKGYVPFLSNAKNMQAYKSNDTEIFLKYDIKENYNGENRLRFQSKELFEAEKVLVKRSSTAGEKKCVIANIDRTGNFVKNSFGVIVPKKQLITLEEIVALLNSDLINAYARMKDVKRSLDIKTINEIPVPNFSKKQTQEIKNLVNSLEINNNDLNKIQRLNEIINEAFGLKKEEINRLKEYWNSNNTIQKNNQISKDDCTLTGIVKKIDKEKMLLKIDFYSLDIEKELKIEGYMPGWLIEENVEFTCTIEDYKIEKIKEEDIYLYNLKPLNYSYMTFEELYNENQKMIKGEVVYG